MKEALTASKSLLKGGSEVLMCFKDEPLNKK